MNFILICGPGAVGKMTIGQELARLTGCRLFHNHMAIEPVLEIFDEWKGNVIKKFRDIVFDEFLSGDYEGLIFTFMWAFDCEEDNKYIENIYQKFISAGHEFYIVELESSLAVRLERNKTENRLNNKASKRDSMLSEKRILSSEREYRLNSLAGEVKYKNYLKIENTNLLPSEVAKIIQMSFNFTVK